MKFTDDVLVKELLRFLMTREVAHFQMFQAALDSIQPNSLLNSYSKEGSDCTTTGFYTNNSACALSGTGDGELLRM